MHSFVSSSFSSKTENLRILFIAMSNSVHSARYICQFNDKGWDLHIFPSIAIGRIHPDIKFITVHQTQDELIMTRLRHIKRIDNFIAKLFARSKIKYCTPKIVRKYVKLNKIKNEIARSNRYCKLIEVINDVKPDIIHSMETQAAGYLTADAKMHFPEKFPPWIHTIWGSDLIYFSKIPKHKLKIQDVMALCDYFSCECRRDILLARQLGYKGPTLPQLPAPGGLDLALCLSLSQHRKTSEKRLIMLKGYHDWAGRALDGLRALEQCSDLLSDYEILISVAAPEVIQLAESLQKKVGLKISIIPFGTPHRKMLMYYGKSRISIGLSITDGLPQSFLESIAMGAFPIQTNTSCAEDWIDDGVSGKLVNPNDIGAVIDAIRLALTNDNLVDNATKLNYKTVKSRLCKENILNTNVRTYNKILNNQI